MLQDPKIFLSFFSFFLFNLFLFLAARVYVLTEPDIVAVEVRTLCARACLLIALLVLTKPGQQSYFAIEVAGA